ncbi:hypothetical protein H4696_000104 [Amycolatopsis lexingtonensis]|uniref:Uncharacterized protein n=1 Tax=Amycolatopsis lexingtonensis TaxID=218822 RepID=A0ABR9HPZ9_9PSEU|nr:hypothetical protein [Amycolatopsis lexingtonensis]MBE1493004.1 hypothetical protein [Amycolatopsis lexingtonensis]
MAASTSPSSAPTAVAPAASPDNAPQPLTPDQLHAATAAVVAEPAAEPVLSPPGAPQAAAAVTTAAAWQSNKKVLALWTNNADRNGYAFVDAVGWRRIATNSDSVHEALLMLATSAKLAGSVTYPEAADGLIHEIYLW